MSTVGWQHDSNYIPLVSVPHTAVCARCACFVLDEEIAFVKHTKHHEDIDELGRIVRELEDSVNRLYRDFKD